MSSPASNDRDGLKPRFFHNLFKYHRVGAIIRLNERLYRDEEFPGIAVYDLEYPDGSNPCDETIREFFRICNKEISNGRSIAVHCRAGLGRTGTLIGLYLI